MENLLFLGVPILKHIRVTFWQAPDIVGFEINYNILSFILNK